jgi:hypothetical protein
VPEVLPGEDEQSYIHHLRKLSDLYMKKGIKEDDVTILMDRTFPHRRRKIVENAPSVAEVVEDHPFLKRCSQFFMEFGRIVHEPLIRSTFSNTWSMWSKKIICLSKREAAKKIENQDCDDDSIGRGWW